MPGPVREGDQTPGGPSRPAHAEPAPSCGLEAGGRALCFFLRKRGNGEGKGLGWAQSKGELGSESLDTAWGLLRPACCPSRGGPLQERGGAGLTLSHRACGCCSPLDCILQAESPRAQAWPQLWQGLDFLGAASQDDSAAPLLPETPHKAGLVSPTSPPAVPSPWAVGSAWAGE